MIPIRRQSRWQLLALLLVWGAWFFTVAVLTRHLDQWAPHAPALAINRGLAWAGSLTVFLISWCWLHVSLISLATTAGLALPRVMGVFALVGGSGWILGIHLAEGSLGRFQRIDESMIGGVVAIHFALGILGATLLVLVPNPQTSERGPLFLASRHSSDRAARRAWLAAFGQWFLLTTACLDALDQQSLLLFAVPLLIGVVIGSWHRCPQRSLGLVPIGWLGAALSWLATSQSPGAISPIIVLGLSLGLCHIPPRTEVLIRVHPARRWVSTLLMALTQGVGACLGLMAHSALGSSRGWGCGSAATAAALALAAFWGFFRELLEILVEPILAVLYRITAAGSGIGKLPTRGPVVVIANHAAWLDPLWIGKVMPFRVRPMMTARFYDLPCISWLMRRVFFTIRVAEVAFRREAPEIQTAIDALDQGDNLLIFPEGWLRRREDLILRRFGHGIHQILSARPQTPVIACWIEGGWGSYVSHKDGPPMRNKPLDVLREIRIGVNEPEIVPADLLADHWRTRRYLMSAVLRAREHLGLPAVAVPYADESNDSIDNGSNEQTASSTQAPSS